MPPRMQPPRHARPPSSSVLLRQSVRAQVLGVCRMQTRSLCRANSRRCWASAACESLARGLLVGLTLTLAPAAAQLMGGAAEARQNLSKLATDVSSWWANLDPVPKAPDTPKACAAGAPESKARPRGWRLLAPMWQPDATTGTSPAFKNAELAAVCAVGDRWHGQSARAASSTEVLSAQVIVFGCPHSPRPRGGCHGGAAPGSLLALGKPADACGRGRGRRRESWRACSGCRRARRCWRASPARWCRRTAASTTHSRRRARRAAAQAAAVAAAPCPACPQRVQEIQF